MDIKQLTPAYAVSPQIAIEDLTLIMEAGFRTIVNNRPDHEIPGHLAAEQMRHAAKALGLVYIDNPVDGHPGFRVLRVRHPVDDCLDDLAGDRHTIGHVNRRGIGARV
jgi:uncharacterized protein (TIGR01244 family)